MQGDCLTLMRDIPDNYVDLTVTSPPYDNMRQYKGYSFDFENIAKQLFRVTAVGGVVVWVVGDETYKEEETGTSFKQALYLKEIGFKLHDTMIWNKGGFSAVGSLQTRYAPVFEYMFIFVKGKIKTFNPLKDRPNKNAGRRITGTNRLSNGDMRPMSSVGQIIKDYGQRFNIWEINPDRNKKQDHPAPFPIEIPNDHILSWSNPNDVVLDCFMGSGTTGVACKNLGRSFIGIEIAEEYFKLASKRIEETLLPLQPNANGWVGAM
jgi:site-specific DNA-methyltransferase (adenine-specific)